MPGKYAEAKHSLFGSIQSSIAEEERGKGNFIAAHYASRDAAEEYARAGDTRRAARATEYAESDARNSRGSSSTVHYGGNRRGCCC